MIWYENFKERFKTPTPWTNFVSDVSKALEDVFVARTPRKKATGELHAETIKSLSDDEPKTYVEVRNGKAANGSMLRTDVFAKKSKSNKERFHLVPVYLFDVAKGILPNKTIGGELIDETFSFKFSIYMDDLIEVKKGSERYYGYFGGTNVANGVIKLFTPDRSIVNDKEDTSYRVGVKTVDTIKKFTVDYLGKDIREVVGEKRLDFSLKKAK